MAKKTGKIWIFLVLFIVVIVTAITLVIVLKEQTPIVNSLAFGYQDSEGNYNRFFYKEIYITGNETNDNLVVKILVNDSLEHSTTQINWGISNTKIVDVVKNENEFIIKPKAEGEVTLTVQSVENTKAVDTCKINIKQKTLNTIKVSKINEKNVTDLSTDGYQIYDIYNINVIEDNECYNRVYLDLGLGNINSLVVLDYDESKIEDVKIDATSSSLQIKTKDLNSGTTLVKLGWKELDSEGMEHIVGQQNLVFNLNKYQIEKIGFMLYTSPNFDEDGVKLPYVSDTTTLYFGTDMYGNIYDTVYIKPFYIYSSGWENFNINIGSDNISNISKITINQSDKEIDYFRINADSNVVIIFKNSEISSVLGKLSIIYKSGDFEYYFLP